MNELPKPCVLITGASSGIGEQYAYALSKRGFDLVLVARREKRLQTIKAHIERVTSVSVETLCADLSTKEGIQTVEKRILSGTFIEWIIHNAGFGLSGLFDGLDPNDLESMCSVHIVGPVRLTRVAVERMKKEKRGTIILVSSLLAFYPIIGSATYPASKAFLNAFGESIRQTLSQYHIRVQTICPGMTRTGFHETPQYKNCNKKNIPSWAWMSAKKVVYLSLRALSQGKQGVYIPGFLNTILAIIFKTGIFNFLFSKIAKKAKRKERAPLV